MKTLTGFYADCRVPGLGRIACYATSRGLQRIILGRPARPPEAGDPAVAAWRRDLRPFDAVFAWLRAYPLARPPALPPLPFDDSALSDFQRAVRRALLTIPRGETRSYRWVAERIGRPKAVRAVGRACGANPFPILIPCHRVIAANGALGGFSAPLAWKRRLLTLEGRHFPG